MRRLTNSEKECTIEGCELTVKAKGYCTRHHQMWLRTGNPIGKREQALKDLIERNKLNGNEEMNKYLTR